ncbi:MAG: DUF3352 domain-containing protein, partial [Anaerolineae bacterium]
METPQPTTPPKSRSRVLLGIGIAVVVVALIGLGVLLIPRLLNTTASTVNVTAAVMPADTQVYLSFNPHFDKLPNGDVVLKAWNDPEIAKSIEDSIRDALEGNDLDWDQDIAPWLGDEIGLGTSNLPLDPNASRETPPSLVLVAATRDTARSDALLAKLRAASEANGSKYTEQAYRGVTTVEQTGPDSGTSMAYATFNSLVVVATSADDLHAAIDASLDGKGLDKSSNYQATLSQLRGGRAVTVYFDLALLLKALFERMEEAGGFQTTPLSQSALESLEALQGMAIGLSFEANGLRFEIIASTDVSKLPSDQAAIFTAPANPNRLLRAAPDSTFLFAGGQNLASLSRIFLESMRSADASVEESLQAFERAAEVDLEKDIFGWMTGEFAIVAMPGAGFGGGTSQIPFGLALIIEAADKQLAETNIHKLIQALAAESRAEISEVIVGDARLHALLDNFNDEPVLVYGVLGDHFVLALSDNTAKKIAGAADGSLADDETFKTAIASLPKNNNGFFYLKPKPIVDLLTLGLTFSG